MQLDITDFFNATERTLDCFTYKRYTMNTGAAAMIYTVTYTIVTPESAEQGDFDECGAVDSYDSLRDALKALRETRTCHVDGVECIDADEHTVTVVNGPEFFTGAQESRALHLPHALTLSTRRRIARIAGARGV